MGDITLTNATLTNNDKGYTLKTEKPRRRKAKVPTRSPKRALA